MNNKEEDLYSRQSSDSSKEEEVKFENDNDEEEEKDDIINEDNIKRVIEHFARRNSVVKILREICTAFALIHSYKNMGDANNETWR